jgi:glycosyltransferase involved in cell wall biosynthesis
MRFLHVSTGDVRGAFSGAYRLHRNLIAHGHESLMLVGDKQTSDPTVIAPSRLAQLVGRTLVRIANGLLKFACGREAQVSHHLAFNVSVFSVSGLLRRLHEFKPDLVVVYYTSGFLSPAQLAKLKTALRSPVAVYLMDMEMLTGGCHYAWSCTGYLGHCVSCPVPRTGLLKRWIRNQWKQRKASLDSIQPVIVAGSGWLMRQASVSTLCADFDRTQILMGINPQLYAPRDKGDLRRMFGLPRDAVVLYFGAQNLGDPRKGFSYLAAALEQLARNLEDRERQSVVLFTVGKSDPRIGSFPAFAHVHRSYISDPASFAATYAAADIFICSSVEDSGPMMINESMMSGTPVAAFEMGVAVDLVTNGETGFRVPLGDSAALASALGSFVRLAPAERARMSAACRSLALERTSAAGQVRAFIGLADRLRT